MHWPDTQTGAPAEETMRAMDRLVQEGKVKCVGVSNYDVPLLEQSMKVRHVDSLQPPYSILRPRVEQELLPYCQRHGIGVIAYSPLTSGLLSGRYAKDHTFPENDWRSRSKAHTGEGFKKNMEIVDQLKVIAADYRLTVAQLALAYVLAHPALTSALVGIRKPDHIQNALPALDVNLDESVLNTIRHIAKDAQ